MKVRAIRNPQAGVAPAAAREAVERGRSSWTDYAVSVTRAPGHAVELAREAVAEGAELVIAVGGDGTVNEVARGLLGSGSTLGIVPMGSGNGLARALRLPLKPKPALAALEIGAHRLMDVGRLNGGLFLNVAGTGFDAVVGAAFQRAGRDGRRRGLLSYLRLSVAEVVRYRPPSVAVEAGGERRELTPFIVTFANGPQYGSGAVINPGGILDDGRLEAVSFAYRGSVAGILAAAPRLFLGGLERMSGYGRVSASRLTVTGESPLAIHRDGDPAESAARIEVELVPRALRVVVPASTLDDPKGPFTRES